MNGPRRLESERCCLCDSDTGNAGRGDGSLYCLCGCGPFCEDCFNREPCPNCRRMTKEQDGTCNSCPAYGPDCVVAGKTPPCLKGEL